MIKANLNDKSLVVDILFNTFDDNNSVNYIVKQDNKREKRIKILMEYSFDICNMFGQIYLSDDKNACALTLFPDIKKQTFKSFMLELKLAFLCVGLFRVRKVLARNSEIKKSYPKVSILYLMFIGVNYTEQSMGIGSKLIKELINESIIMQRPIFLETSMQKNIRFYKKWGFEIYHVLDFGHKLFLFKRELN